MSSKRVYFNDINSDHEDLNKMSIAERRANTMSRYKERKNKIEAKMERLIGATLGTYSGNQLQTVPELGQSLVASDGKKSRTYRIKKRRSNKKPRSSKRN